MIVDQVVYQENKSEDYRASLLYIDGIYQCQTVEKLSEAIPIGTYELVLRMDYTDLTQMLCSKLEWFEWLAEIQVPDKENVYIGVDPYHDSNNTFVVPCDFVDHRSGKPCHAMEAWLDFHPEMTRLLEQDSAVYNIVKLEACPPLLYPIVPQVKT